MKNFIKILNDNNNYLIINITENKWGEGKSLEDAYTNYINKNSLKVLLPSEKTKFVSIGLIWLEYRKLIIIILFIIAFIYAQAAVFLGLLSYLGNNTAERAISTINMVSDKIENMSQLDVYKTNLALKNLNKELSKFSISNKCDLENDEK